MGKENSWKKMSERRGEEGRPRFQQGKRKAVICEKIVGNIDKIIFSPMVMPIFSNSCIWNRDYQNCLLVFKLINDLAPTYLYDGFVFFQLLYVMYCKAL